MSFFFGDVKSDELKIENGIELYGGTGNAYNVKLNASANLTSNIDLKLPPSMGSPGQALILNNAAGDLIFSTVSGGSTTLSSIGAGTGESNLTTTAGNIYIAPDVGNILLNVPTASYYSFDINNIEALHLNSTTITANTALKVNSTANITGATEIGGTLDVTGATNLNDQTQSTNTTSGALIVDGGVGIASNVNIGGNVNVSDSLSISGDITTANTFTLTQGAITISSNSTVTLDLSDRSDFILTYNGAYNVTLSLTNVNKQGQQGTIIVKTPSSGTGTLSWSTGVGWYFPSATAPTMSTGNNVYDTYSYLVVDSSSPHVLVMDATNFQPYT